MMSTIKPARSTSVRLTGLLFLTFSAWLILGPAISQAGLYGTRWPRNDPNATRDGACVTYSFMADGTVIANPPDTSNTGAGTSDFDANVSADAGVGGQANARAAIRRALATWEAAADIHFLEVADNGTAFNGAGAIGDIRFGGHNFAGTTLAHGYYPPPNGVSADGDIHFDGGFNWWAGAAAPPGGSYDLESVSLHEIGHAIGLTHAPVGPDVMDPTIGSGTTERVLTVGAGSDTALAQSIYGAPGHVRDCTNITGIVIGTPTLPPPGTYLLPHEVHATYSGADLEIILNRALHKPFAGSAEIRQGPEGEHERFHSSLETTLTVKKIFGEELPKPMKMDVQLEGPVETLVREKKVGEHVGDWETEMLSMSLTGYVKGPDGEPIPIAIRENPEKMSWGRTVVSEGTTAPYSAHDDKPPTDEAMFHIDSFFNVFTEISVGGGEWVPADRAAGVNLVPEPSSVVLAVMGLVALVGFVRRRKRAA